MINIGIIYYLFGKNMADKSLEQLKAEEAEQSALVASTKAELDKQKIFLKQQQNAIRTNQATISSIAQASVGKSPALQQINANAIISLQESTRRLEQAAIATNEKINTLSTQAVTYENNVKDLQSQITTITQTEIQGPPVPAPVATASTTTDQQPVKDIPPFPDQSGNGAPIIGNPDINVNISGPLQSNTVVIPDENEIQGPPTSAIQPEPIKQPQTQVFDDGSTLTTSADGTPVSSTPATDGTISSPLSGTILAGVGALAAGVIGGKLLQKSPKNIQETVKVAAITGAVGLATKALFGSKGLSINKQATQGAQSNTNAKGTKNNGDWRVKLSLAKDANSKYLYNAEQPGILAPLAKTDGVLFPYLPAISVTYGASYDATDIAHSNYKIFSYKQSMVDNISITGDFTAQDTNEANYLLAVIHFFRSVTKMFYGKDNNPKPGTPPPLCYLTGMGEFQFKNHPLVITNFTYTLPTDVDYIRATNYAAAPNGDSQAMFNTPYNPTAGSVRLPQYLKPGGIQGPPQWKTAQGTAVDPTYVPTKMMIQLQAFPIVTRGDISSKFSLQDYANGKIYGGVKGSSRGIW